MELHDEKQFCVRLKKRKREKMWEKVKKRFAIVGCVRIFPELKKDTIQRHDERQLLTTVRTGCFTHGGSEAVRMEPAIIFWMNGSGMPMDRASSCCLIAGRNCGRDQLWCRLWVFWEKIRCRRRLPSWITLTDSGIELPFLEAGEEKVCGIPLC